VLDDCTVLVVVVTVVMIIVVSAVVKVVSMDTELVIEGDTAKDEVRIYKYVCAYIYK